MADEIILGKLVIDTSDLANEMANSKKAIIELENEQKKLKKDTENLTTANEEQLKSFVDNEVELKRMRSEYAANQKSVLDLTKAQTGLDDALKKNVKTQKEAADNTAALVAARRQIDATTVDGAKAIADINAKIDANNKFLNANNSELEKQKVNIGNYPQLIGTVGAAFGGAAQKVIGFAQGGRDTVEAFAEVSSAVQGTIKNVIGFSTASNKASQGMEVLSAGAEGASGGVSAVGAGSEGASKGIFSMLKASLAFIATPLGAVLAAIAIVLGLVINAFSKLDPVVDKVEQGMAAVGAVLDVLNGSIVAFISGSKSFTEAFGNMGGAMAEAAKEAAALKEAQQDLADSQRIQEVANAKASQQYDELILKSKNRTLTEKERIAFLNKAQAIEEANFKKRAELAQAELDNALKAVEIKAQLTDKEIAGLKKSTVAYANYLLNTGRITEEQLEAIKEAELGKIAIQAESTKRLEKAQNAEDKLAEDAQKKREERAAKQKAAADKARAEELKNAQNRIDILKLEANQSNLTTEQRIANAQKIFELENALAKKSLSGSDQTKKLLENRQALSSAILKIAEDQINAELELQKKAFSEKAAANQNELDAQVESAELLAKAQIALLDKRLLTEKDFATKVEEINKAKNENISIANQSFDEAEKVRKEAELANTRALEEVAHQIRLQDIADRGLTESEQRAAQLQEDYNNELLLLQQNLTDKKISYDLYIQQKTLADKKFASETAKNDKIIADQKKAMNKQMLSDGLTTLNALFGDSKAVAVATALVNTYQGIAAGVKLGYPAAIPAVAAAAATGFAAVKNILKTDKGSTSVDSGGGASATTQTTTGAASFVNSAQTETVARVSDTPVDDRPAAPQQVLVLESLMEVQNNLAVKIQSQ